MSKISIQSSAALLGFLLAGSSAFGQNLLTNGGFETGALGEAPPSWTIVQTGNLDEPPVIQDDLTGQANPVAAAEGFQYLRLRADNTAGTGGPVGAAIVEQITSTDVQLGFTYTLDLQHTRNQGGGGKILAYAIGYDDGGGFTELASNSYAIASALNRNNWVTLDTLSHTVSAFDNVPAGADIGVRITNQATGNLNIRGYVDDIVLNGFLAPPVRFNRIDLDGSGVNLINGSFEDVVADAGGDATANGAIKDSSTSFAPNIANPLTVTQWAPYDAEDPNDVIGRYGTAGSVTTDSYYLDINSVNNAVTEGARGILMNSTDGYRHGLVNEDFLAAIDPQFINPSAEYVVTVDLQRRNANTLANDTATATFALTDSATEPFDLSNAIPGGLASVNQGSLEIGTTSEALTLTLSGADLVNATQLNLVVDTVNTMAVGVETTPGQELAYVSQIAFDNIVITGYLPGDSDGDFDIDQDDIDALYASIGSPGIMDLDDSGTVDADDIGLWLMAASNANPFNPDAKTFVIGDANLDGDVDSTDLGLLLNNFGDSTSQTWMNGNMNGDANVDSTDLGLLLNNFGSMSAATAVVPEPGCLSLVFFAVLGLVIRTCRSRLR